VLGDSQGLAAMRLGFHLSKAQVAVVGIKPECWGSCSGLNVQGRCSPVELHQYALKFMAPVYSLQAKSVWVCTWLQTHWLTGSANVVTVQVKVLWTDQPRRSSTYSVVIPSYWPSGHSWSWQNPIAKIGCVISLGSTDFSFSISSMLV